MRSHEKKSISLVSACDASSAAPAYFPCVEVNNVWYIDGGVVANNPTMVAYAEACKIWGRGQDISVLSVGTGGMEGNAKGWGGIQWLKNGLLDVATFKLEIF